MVAGVVVAVDSILVVDLVGCNLVVVVVVGVVVVAVAGVAGVVLDHT